MTPTFKIKKFSTYICLMCILLVVAFLYQRYKNKLDNETSSYNYDAIQNFLLNDSDKFQTEYDKIKKPILWIHVKQEYNSRNWSSFGSRSSFELNQPYLYLTTSSIIKMCNASFHICVIDDNSFQKLIPEWNINLSRVGAPTQDYIRNLGMCKILHRYGGIRVPVSFVCMRDLDELYTHGTINDKMFVCQLNDRNVTSVHREVYPSIQFMGCKKDDIVMAEFIEYIQRTISGDFTSELQFLGEFDRWVNTRVERNQINLIDGKLIGTKTIEDETILIDNLLSNEYIDIYSKTYGIYIPADEVLSRRHYEWFSRMSPRQVLEGKMIIAKYLLLSNTPDAKMGVIEQLKNNPNWNGFWNVPSGAPVWGPKPIDLGNIAQIPYPSN